MKEMIQENKQALLKVRDRWVENSEGFFESHKFALSFLIIAAFLDAFSTFCFMYVSGAELEMHPLVRQISLLTGPIVGPFLGGLFKILAGVVVLIYIRKVAKPIMILAGIFYSYAFMYNLSVSGAFNLL